MYSRAIEAQYPLDFRKKDATTLGNHLRHRHSVTMIGMKRVGISNFLRFFFSHADMWETYIQDREKHVFIVVDLNDLVEREVFPFWTLTLKRIVDTVEGIDLSSRQKKKIESLFLKAIQLQDHFMAMDSTRQALVALIEWGFVPTLFLVHFDRIKDAVTSAFFDNLESLLNTTGNRLSYVFTSFRSLDALSPAVFSKNSLPFFCESMYLTLAEKKDMQTIFTAYDNRYKLNLPKELGDALFRFVNGHIQYLQLSLLALQENEKITPQTSQQLFDLLVQDERIVLQSEELWDSLAETEKDVLLKVVKTEAIADKEKKQAAYLWVTGSILSLQGELHVFSPLFQSYLEQRMTRHVPQSVHFSKKENALFHFLEQHLGEICERDEIVGSVWPEYGEVGISDWAIDRLVARVRTKLRQQGSKYEIKTIRTRGYQLVER